MTFINITLFITIILEILIIFYYFFISELKRNIKILLLTNLIIIIISILRYIENNMFENIMDIYSFLVLMTSLLSIIILKLVYYIHILSNKNNKLLKCIVEYENTIDEQGKRNHEYNNQLLVLKGYINNKDRLKDYLNIIIDDQNKNQNYRIRQLSNFPNGGLKELLYYKICEIKDKKIKYYLYCSTDISKYMEKLSVRFYNSITKIFGVLIDNAIDGALEAKEKEVILDFNKDDKYIVITISNTYNNINKKCISSKGKGHGFGLKLVKEIINKNKGLELLTEYNDKYFVQTLLIKIE